MATLDSDVEYIWTSSANVNDKTELVDSWHFILVAKDPSGIIVRTDEVFNGKPDEYQMKEDGTPDEDNVWRAAIAFSKKKLSAWTKSEVLALANSLAERDAWKNRLQGKINREKKNSESTSSPVKFELD